jgi:hypothetical protein
MRRIVQKPFCYILKNGASHFQNAEAILLNLDDRLSPLKSLNLSFPLSQARRSLEKMTVGEMIILFSRK